MTSVRGARPWPGSVEWGDDWLAQTTTELAHLGFELRDGSLPGTHPGPRLLVSLRAQPTFEHFDPEEVTYWVEGTDGRCHLASLSVATGLPVNRPWSWGQVRVSDRIPVSNQFLGFGGTLLADANDGQTTYVAFVSPAPIVRWAGHSQGVDPLVDEIGAFFARLMIPIDYQEGAERRVAEASPEALYAVFLDHSLERIKASRRLRDADPQVAGWVRHEAARLARDAPAHWRDGVQLRQWLQLG
jgi:hypothetical protein